MKSILIVEDDRALGDGLEEAGTLLRRFSRPGQGAKFSLFLPGSGFMGKEDSQ